MSKTFRQNSLGQIDLAALGIDPSQLRPIAALRQTQTHIVWRLAASHSSYILKGFADPDNAVELRVYPLLARHGVETLPVLRRTHQALLLEDLESSPRWRLARPADMALAETGEAVAAWYRALHQAGRELLSEPQLQLPWLRPWVDAIDELSLQRAGAALKLQDEPVWHTAARQLDALKTRYLALPQTFNYNDFAAENLALSRSDQPAGRAIVFDYDCFATGVVYSDWRNVVYSLHGAAKAAFVAAYGAIDEEERWLDEPLATLYGLIVASQRSKTPAWAEPLIAAVFDGELARSLGQTRGMH